MFSINRAMSFLVPNIEHLRNTMATLEWCLGCARQQLLLHPGIQIFLRGFLTLLLGCGSELRGNASHLGEEQRPFLLQLLHPTD